MFIIKYAEWMQNRKLSQIDILDRNGNECYNDTCWLRFRDKWDFLKEGIDEIDLKSWTVGLVGWLSTGLEWMMTLVFGIEISEERWRFGDEEVCKWVLVSLFTGLDWTRGSIDLTQGFSSRVDTKSGETSPTGKKLTPHSSTKLFNQ